MPYQQNKKLKLMLNKNKIQIAILEISDRNKAVLEFYFNSAGEDFYTLVSKDKADAFISDYDSPGAKENLDQILESNNKPVVILSIKEQNVPSTIWLAKPLTATALTNAAETLKQMISANEIAAAKTISDQTESVSAEIIEETKAEEVVQKEENNLDEIDDIFEVLDETEEQDESQSIGKKLIAAKAKNLVSAASVRNSVNNNTQNIIEASLPEEPTKIPEEINEVISEESADESSKLEFSDVVIEEQNTQDESRIESESEVDALLQSLILGTGNKVQKNTVDKDNTEKESDDILFESLEPDEEQEDSAASQDEINDTADFADSLNEELLSETIDDNNESIVVEEKQEVMLEESFMLHDDLNPSDEDVYSETLKVNYADLKTNKAESKSSNLEETAIKTEEVNELSLDVSDASAQSENILDVIFEEPLETDLFKFQLDTNNTTEEITIDESKDPSKEASLALVGDIDSSKLSVDTDTENLKSDSEDVLDMDLDSLLKEVSVAGSDFVEKPKKPSEASFIPTDTLTIDDGINKHDKLEPASKNSPDFELQSLLNEVRNEAGKSGNNNPEVFAGGLNSNKETEKASAYDKTKAEERWAQLCGNFANIKEQKEVANISFVLTNHLLGVLLQQIKSTKNSEQLFRLKFGELIIVIDHSKNKIYCNLPVISDDYSAICFSELNPLEIKVHDLDYSEVRLYRTKIDQNPDRAHSIESFVWSTSLLVTGT